MLNALEQALLRLRTWRARIAGALGAAVLSLAASALVSLPGRGELYLGVASSCGLIWLLTSLAAPGLLLGPRARLAWWVNLAGVVSALLAPLLLAAIAL
jgi:hypothetical protein